MAMRPFACLWRNGLAGVALTALASASAPAKAQALFSFFAPAPTVGAPAVAASVERQGYVVRSAIVRRGDVYMVDVSDPSGAMERLVVDAHNGRVVQRTSWRSDPYRQAAPRYANAPAFGGGFFNAPPRPEVDVPANRPYAVEVPDVAPRVIAAYPPDGETRTPRHDLDFGGDSRTVSPGFPQEQKPAEKPRAKVAKPRPVVVPSILPTAAALQPPRPETTATPAVEAAKPAVEAAKPAIEAVKPAAAPAKPAPPKSEGVVASTGQTDAHPAQPAPVVAPPAPKEKSKAVNDIPVTPLD